MIGVSVLEIAHLEADGFPDAQAGVIDQGQDRMQARLMHRFEDGGDLLSGQDQRQGVRRGDAQILEHGPVQAEFEMFAKEGAQGAFGHFHGRAAELLILAQEEEVTAQIVLGGGGGITLEMIGKPADIADVFLFGGLAIIFELDKVRELCDGCVGRDG